VIPGFAIVWQGQTTTGFLTKQGTWSLDAANVHVFATWAAAKSRSRAFKGSDVVEAWT